MTRRLLTRHTLARIAAALIAIATVSILGLAAATPAAYAEHEDRALHLTRMDGSPVGTLFSDWIMVPGDKVSTTVIAHRTGQGESSLLITLGTWSDAAHTTPTAVEEDVLISIRANGSELTSTASALMTGAAVFDLGRSAASSVPIEVTFELPFSSGNATQQQSLDLSLVVTAADLPESTPTQPGTDDSLASLIPSLPSTGTSARDLLIVAAAATTTGLLFLGGKRKTQTPSQSH